jgi:hypothetical protein
VGRDLGNEPALSHDMDPMGHPTYELEILLDKRDREPPRVRQVMEVLGNLIDHGRLDPFARLVEQHHARPPYEATRTVPPSWPGPTNAASQQVWNLYIIPDMFAQYATGRMTLDQAIGWGEREMLAIYSSKRRT